MKKKRKKKQTEVQHISNVDLKRITLHTLCYIFIIFVLIDIYIMKNVIFYTDKAPLKFHFNFNML